MSDSWDKHGFARLAESVDAHGEGPDQGLEINRQDIFFIGADPPELKERVFNLTIYNGDDDLTFSGLSGRQICQIAEDLIRLVDGRVRIEPPPPPGIKF